MWRMARLWVFRLELSRFGLVVKCERNRKSKDAPKDTEQLKNRRKKKKKKNGAIY